MPTEDERGVASSLPLRIAFMGNSILYFNDCPRLLEQMIEVGHGPVKQDSCLRPSASLVSLWTDGNGMQDRFQSPAALLPDGVTFDIGSPSVSSLLSSDWDFVVMNDHTQSPVRTNAKEATKKALADHYVCRFGSSQVIFLQTAAYREPNINHSEYLRDFEEFESRLEIGYQEYVHHLNTLGISTTRVAPFGRAVWYLRHNDRQLWLKTYGSDGFHPSPHGTWLMACVLYCTLLRTPPPAYNADWWKKCRYFEQPLLSLPSADEAQELSRIACIACKDPQTKSR